MPPLTAAAATSASGGGSITELASAADFAAIASPGGRISVIGFGSLLSGERHHTPPPVINPEPVP
jgi:hypothetical protein